MQTAARAATCTFYVNVQPHPIFERRGNDVWCELPITFTQAALGAEVVVPTIDGKVEYQVHAGTQPGDVFKLRAQGNPEARRQRDAATSMCA